MPAVGIVILAAGGSTRLGRPKQLLPYQGRSLLRRAAETAIATSCRPVIVVLGATADACRSELQDLPVLTVQNPDWTEGLSSSIRLGVATLQAASPPPLDAAIVMLCDQPLLTAAILEALVTTFETTDCEIVASDYGGASGVPALFHHRLFPELLRLTGPQGAKQVMRLHAEQTRAIPFPDGAIDVDTPADYEKLKRASE
jgi:molybdenum cofactor cytidylyltransferase